MIVFAIEQRERDDLVDRHDLGVAQGRGEQLAEVVEGRLDPLPRRAVVVDDDRRRVRHSPIVAVHWPFAIVTVTSLGAARIRGRFARDDFELHAPLGAGLLVEHAGRDQLAAGDQVGGKTNLDHRRGTNAEAGRVDGVPVGMLAEQRRIEAPFCSRQSRIALGVLDVLPSSSRPGRGAFRRTEGPPSEASCR